MCTYLNNILPTFAFAFAPWRVRGKKSFSSKMSRRQNYRYEQFCALWHEIGKFKHNYYLHTVTMQGKEGIGKLHNILFHVRLHRKLENARTINSDKTIFRSKHNAAITGGKLRHGERAKCEKLKDQHNCVLCWVNVDSMSWTCEIGDSLPCATHFKGLNVCVSMFVCLLLVFVCVLTTGPLPSH